MCPVFSVFDNDKECPLDVARNEWVSENTLCARNKNLQDGLPDPRAVCAEQITYYIGSNPNLSDPPSCIVLLVASVGILRGRHSCRMYLELDEKIGERSLATHYLRASFPR
jgi:hypothetical protein